MGSFALTKLFCIFRYPIGLEDLCHWGWRPTTDRLGLLFRRTFPLARSKRWRNWRWRWLFSWHWLQWWVAQVCHQGTRGKEDGRTLQSCQSPNGMFHMPTIHIILKEKPEINQKLRCYNTLMIVFSQEIGESNSAFFFEGGGGTKVRRKYLDQSYSSILVLYFVPFTSSWFRSQLLLTSSS